MDSDGNSSAFRVPPTTPEQIPAIGVVVLGICIAAVGIYEYYVRITTVSPGVDFGPVAAAVLFSHLVFACLLIATGYVGIKDGRIALSSAVFVGVSVLISTFIFDIYTGLPNSRTRLTVGILVPGIPSVVTWVIVHKLSRQDNR